MRAVWLEDQTISLRDIPTPASADEALIRIRLAGICGTDLELVRGYYPFSGIPGHEFVGEVVEAPEPAWVGRRVVGEINVACGTCEPCRKDRPRHCDRRTVLGINGRHGVHAEYTRLPLANLYMVPDSVPDEAAVFTEPLAAALEIQEQVQILPGDRLLLIGAGRLGQLIAQTLALSPASLHVLARHPQQRALLEGRGIHLIAEAEIQPRGWDVVVEATGSPSGFELARRAVRPRGTLVLKSTFHGEIALNLSPLVVDEVTLVGSRCGPFAPALRLLERRAVDPAILIAERHPLAAALQAYESARQPGRLKVLLEP